MQRPELFQRIEFAVGGEDVGVDGFARRISARSFGASPA